MKTTTLALGTLISLTFARFAAAQGSLGLLGVDAQVPAPTAVPTAPAEDYAELLVRMRRDIADARALVGSGVKPLVGARVDEWRRERALLGDLAHQYRSSYQRAAASVPSADALRARLELDLAALKQGMPEASLPARCVAASALADQARALRLLDLPFVSQARAASDPVPVPYSPSLAIGLLPKSMFDRVTAAAGPAGAVAFAPYTVPQPQPVEDGAALGARLARLQGLLDQANACRRGPLPLAIWTFERAGTDFGNQYAELSTRLSASVNAPRFAAMRAFAAAAARDADVPASDGGAALRQLDQVLSDARGVTAPVSSDGVTSEGLADLVPGGEPVPPYTAADAAVEQCLPEELALAVAAAFTGGPVAAVR